MKDTQMQWGQQHIEGESQKSELKYREGTENAMFINESDFI